MGYLIDTSIFIAWERGQLSEVPGIADDEAVALSAITASELLHGVHRADTASRRARRASFVEPLLATVPVLPIDLAVARTHAMIWADLRAQGTVIGAHDLLIAATALTHELILATRNVREFARVEALKVVTW